MINWSLNFQCLRFAFITMAELFVGNRIRVNANRPQNTNQLGIVEKVISVTPFPPYKYTQFKWG